MCSVTGRFTCGKRTQLHKPGNSPQKLAALVCLSHPEGKVTCKREWPQLKNVLCPDPLATSTFARVVDWITHSDVDVLANCSKGVCKPCQRNLNLMQGYARILNRPVFLHGETLPAVESRWWGGGQIEESPIGDPHLISHTREGHLCDLREDENPEGDDVRRLPRMNPSTQQIYSSLENENAVLHTTAQQIPPETQRTRHTPPLQFHK